MNFAIVESGGKQYLVGPKARIQVEKIEGSVGDSIKLQKILFASDGQNFSLGKPYLENSSVEAKIVKQARSKKIIVFKYKSKSRYRRKLGHRQYYTELEITKV